MNLSHAADGADGADPPERTDAGGYQLDQRMRTMIERPGNSERLEGIQARIAWLAQGLTARSFSTAPIGDKLKVFISSDMLELYDVREFVARNLIERGIDAWIHEARAGARPESVIETSLRETEIADIYVGLFWRKYGEVTVQEYRHARKLGRPCFIYVRDQHCQRDQRLAEFLRSEVYDPHRGVNYDFFDSAVRLGQQVAEDIMAWLVRRHREMIVEIERTRIAQEELARLRAEVEQLRTADQSQ
jgi:hypothetical protein